MNTTFSYRPQWWKDWFGIKKIEIKPPKERPWCPRWHKRLDGILLCQHDTEESVHCCNCHYGIRFEGMVCRCVGEEE